MILKGVYDLLLIILHCEGIGVKIRLPVCIGIVHATKVVFLREVAAKIALLGEIAAKAVLRREIAANDLFRREVTGSLVVFEESTGTRHNKLFLRLIITHIEFEFILAPRILGQRFSPSAFRLFDHAILLFIIGPILFPPFLLFQPLQFLLAPLFLQLLLLLLFDAVDIAKIRHIVIQSDQQFGQRLLCLLTTFQFHMGLHRCKLVHRGKINFSYLFFQIPDQQ